MATFTTSSYEGRYLQLSITEAVDAPANKSTLSWTLSVLGGSASWYATGATTVSINGTQVYYKARVTDEFPGKKGSMSGTIDVPHNSDGTKSVTVVFSTTIYYGEWNIQDYGGTMTLTAIDRTAPTVMFSASSITANGFKISATSSATADIWQYSTNNGSSWTQFSTTAGTSASVTLTGLSPNTTYTTKVRARKKSNQVYGTSSATSIKTLGGAIVNSATAVTADASTVSIKLNVTVYEASYTNTLVLKNGSTAYLTISGLSWSKGTADRTITLTSAQRTTLLTAMASLKSFTGTFAVSTYSGSTQIGSTSSATATVSTSAANSAPTLSGFTYADSYSTTTAITGNNQVFIQGYSKLQVTPGTATAKNNATIASYSATCNGVTVSNTTGSALTVGTVAKSGSVAVVLTVTDSRGYTASVTQNITVIAYAKPKLNSVSLRRTNDIETEMQLIFNGSFSAISVSSVTKNSLQYVRYRYKLTSATSYGSYVSILSAVTVSGTSFSYSNLELCDLDSGSSYDFQLEIRDKLNSLTAVTFDFVVPQGTPLVALRKTKVGINTPSPTEALDVVGNAKVSGTLTATTLSGTLAASKLSGTVAISKGGTGATSASAALTNLGAVPKSGAALTGQLTRSGNGCSWITGRDNAIIRTLTNTTSSSFFPVISGKATSGTWDVGVLGSNFYLSYATDANYNAGTNTTTTMYFNTSGNFSGKAANVTGTVAVANGGTGATSAATARTNLGITCTSLYSGTLTTGSTTFSRDYKGYVIVGIPASSYSRVAIFVPKAIITTSAVAYQFADEAYYYAFNLSYSGSTVTLAYKGRSSSGAIVAVYGVN